ALTGLLDRLQHHAHRPLAQLGRVAPLRRMRTPVVCHYSILPSKRWSLHKTRGEGPRAERPKERGQREAAAKAICARCQVRDACAAYAFAYQERYGIWGGLTERERLQAWADHRRSQLTLGSE